MLPCPVNPQQLDQFICQPPPEVVETVAQVDGSIAVLGAGGKMGFHVCWMLQQALQQAGRTERITAVSRFTDAGSAVRFESAGIDVIRADLSDEETVADLPDFDNVFFLAGVKFGTDSNPSLLDRMNVQMPALVAGRYSAARIVALSSGCVYSFTTPESGGSTEESPTEPPGAYARSCLGRESAFVSQSRHGLRSCLIRLNYSIDLRYGVILDIAQKVKNNQPIDLTTGHVNVIWQGDAVAHIIRALPLCNAPPRILNVTGADVLRVRDLADAFGARWNTVPSFQGSEAPTAWLSNSSQSHRLFGPPETGIAQMIQWTGDWLDAGGELLDRPTHFQVRDGRY